MKTAIYLRQSLDRDETKLAITRQREDLLRLCQQRGWDDPIEYVDNSVSASKGSRPAYGQLLEDIRNGIVGKVGVWDLDRLHRQPMELEEFISLADRCNVELATVAGDVDLSTDGGRLFARIKGAVARSEVERKSARQKRANRQRAENGKAWNVRTFGYDGNAVVKAEADAIKQACRDLLDGATLYGIAKQWNAAGLKTAKGGEWNGGTVRQVLSRPRNAGLVVHDVRSSKRHADAILTDKHGQPVKAQWPAIVSRDTFDAVTALLADPSRHSGKRQALRYLLSGIARCGLCGSAMASSFRRNRTGEKRPVLQCKQCMKLARAMAPVDRFVIDVVTGRLARPDAAALFAKDSVDTKELGAQVSTLRAKIAAAEAEFAEGDITGRDLKMRRERLLPKIEAIEAQLLGAQSTRRLDGLIGNTKAREVFEALPLDRQRAVIETVCTIRILPNVKAGGAFDPSRIEVEWK